MEVFQNGPTGQTVVCRVALDSNYVIETVPVPLRRMEDKVVKARILQKGEYVWWDLVMCQVIKLFVLLWIVLVTTELSKRKISISEKPFKKMIFDLLS